jgi:hypothetical protein
MSEAQIANPAANPNPEPGSNTTTSVDDRSGFFQEDNGNNSSIRLMSFVALLAAIVFGFLTIKLASEAKQDGVNGIYITFGFLIAAFAPKVVQKFAEEKLPPLNK